MALFSAIDVGKILTPFLLLKAIWLKNIEFVGSHIMEHLGIISAMFVKVGFIQKVLENKIEGTPIIETALVKKRLLIKKIHQKKKEYTQGWAPWNLSCLEFKFDDMYQTFLLT